MTTGRGGTRAHARHPPARTDRRRARRRAGLAGRTPPAGRPRSPRPRRRPGRHRRPPRRRRLGRRPAGDGRQHAAELRLAAAPSARRSRPPAPGGSGLRPHRRPRELLDVHRFEDRVAAARAALVSGSGTERSATSRRRSPSGTVRSWRRSPTRTGRAPAAVRWEELRLEALETRFDALLALGRHAEAVPELERMVDEHPLREGFARRLMLALYRSGRQAEALRAFTRTRTVLADELGLDPTPDLAGLQAAILDHDPDLARARQHLVAAGRDRRAARRGAATTRRGAGPAARPGRSPRPWRLRRARRSARRAAGDLGAHHWGRQPPRAAAGRSGRRQVPARRPVRCARARRGRHRPVGTGDGGGDRAVRADGRGDPHRPAGGVRRGPAAGGGRARPARPAAPRPRAARARAPSWNAPIRASSATCCSRPSPSCCAASRRSTRCSSCSTTSSGPTRRRSR